MRLEPRRRAQHEGQRLVPRAEVRHAGDVFVRLGVEHVRHEHVVHAVVEQRLHVAVRDLTG